LKLEHDIPLSSFAFNCNLRRYNMEQDEEDKADPAEVLAEYFHETMSNLAWLHTAVKV